MAYGMYPTYGTSYGNNYPQYPQQTYQQMPQQSYQAQNTGIDWVDGESAARAMQLPAGVTQHAMWDINEPVIYLKSVNQMGMPNPLRKIRYTMEDVPQNSGGQSQAMLTSGEAEHTSPDMSQYVRKDDADLVKKGDLDRMKQEIIDSIQGSNTRRTAKGE